MADIVLTADRTMMSTHHDSEFLGFGTCIPPYILPTSVYGKLFFPPVRAKQGVATVAPYALRKVEAKLIDLGFDVVVAHPSHLRRFNDAKVIGISTMDPFGLGPASSTFAAVLQKGEPFNALFFKKLIEDKNIKKAKENGAKIIVGGPGTWQFEHMKDFAIEHGIDCIVMGEVEKDAETIFRKALNGEELPLFYEAYKSPAPTLEEIPEIKHASVNGLVEVGRGCPRGCPFCDVTKRRLRWYPLEKIEKELEVNNREGIDFGIMHAEDVLLYGVHGVKPDIEKIEALFKLFAKHYKRLSWSHTSIAAVAAEPRAAELAKELFLNEQDWFGVEIGIETGSPKLIERSMPAKAKPFEAKDWQDVVCKALATLHDNNIVPACTLIVGLPDEREEDTLATIELMDKIKDYRCMVVPLFFVPLGRLTDRNWFRAENLSASQIELLEVCLSHGLRWSKELARGYNKGHVYSPMVNASLVGFIKMIERVAKRKNLVKEIPANAFSSFQ